jgi:hypothetical protein
MFREATARHRKAHFHVVSGSREAVYGIRPIERLEGSLSPRDKRLAEAWAELHREELLRDWRLLQQGRKPVPIAPLR